MVDALVLGTSGAIHGGSSPLPPTKKESRKGLFWREKALGAFVEDLKTLSLSHGTK